MVGHTHEDVDQMFGVVLSLVLQRHKFQTPVITNGVSTVTPVVLLKTKALEV